MHIHLALETDIDEIYKLYDEYGNENIGLNIFNKDKVTAAILRMIKQNCVMVAKVDGKIVGGTAGVILPCDFTTDLMFVGMFLYFKKGFRNLVRKFLKELELMIKVFPVTKIVFSAPAFAGQEKLERFYKMCGYKVLEVHYCKEL